MTTPRPNQRRHDPSVPLAWLAALTVSLSLWAGFLSAIVPAAIVPAADGTDTAVGCVNDCLDPEPIDTSADAEPIRADQEETKP